MTLPPMARCKPPPASRSSSRHGCSVAVARRYHARVLRGWGTSTQLCGQWVPLCCVGRYLARWFTLLNQQNLTSLFKGS